MKNDTTQARIRADGRRCTTLGVAALTLTAGWSLLMATRALAQPLEGAPLPPGTRAEQNEDAPPPGPPGAREFEGDDEWRAAPDQAPAMGRARRGDGFGRGMDPRPDGPPRARRFRDPGRVRGFVEEHFPQMFGELNRLRIRDPQRCEQHWSQITPEIEELMELSEREPEVGLLAIRERRLDMRSHMLARRYRQTADEFRREELRDEIRRVCAEALNCRLQRREREIRGLETRLSELRDRHAEARRMREEIIEREVERRLAGPVVRPGAGPHRGRGPARGSGWGRDWDRENPGPRPQDQPSGSERDADERP